MMYGITELFLWFSLACLCITEIYCWPEGTYGLPMAEGGCPHSNTFEWITGSRTQKTEQGSHAADNNHLAGITATKSQPDNKIVQNFCIKTSYAADGEYQWQPGKYCIYKKDVCPEGFQDGHVYWDDNVPFLFGETNIQDYSGTLPDGDYDKNTDIYFCCRNDGSTSQAIKLPTSSDFYLLQLGRVCQKVEGMKSSEEWIYWTGENTFNFDDEGGLHPRLTRTKFPTKYTRLYYCYYSPMQSGTSLQKALYIVYVFASVVAFVILSLAFMCIVQKCNGGKFNETPHNAENCAPILQYTANNDHCVVYRPDNGEIRHHRPPSRDVSNYRPSSGDYGNFRPSSGEFGDFRPPSIEFRDYNGGFKPSHGEGDILMPSAPPMSPEYNNDSPASHIPSPPSYEEVVQKASDSYHHLGDPV